MSSRIFHWLQKSAHRPEARFHTIFNQPFELILIMPNRRPVIF